MEVPFDGPRPSPAEVGGTPTAPAQVVKEAGPWSIREAPSLRVAAADRITNENLKVDNVKITYME